MRHVDPVTIEKGDRRVQIHYGLTLLTLFGVLSQGCAADVNSRALASRLRQLTAQYNAMSTAKIEAERSFYVSSLRNLDDTLNVAHPEDDRRSANVKDTLAYGRIITSTNAAALALIVSLADKGRPSGTANEIAEFVRAGAREEEAEFIAARALQARAAEALLVDFDNLAQYQSKLTNLTKELAALEIGSSPKARVSQMEAIGRAVLAQLKKTSKSDPADETPPAP